MHLVLEVHLGSSVDVMSDDTPPYNISSVLLTSGQARRFLSCPAIHKAYIHK
jgi:hypothetical protein